MGDKTKEWYIKIHGFKEGPYSIVDLRDDDRFTPDTLVWRKGFKEWLPAKRVGPLAKIFKKRKRPKKRKSEGEEYPTSFTPDGLVIDARSPPPNIIIWLIIIILLLIYILLKLNLA